MRAALDSMLAAEIARGVFGGGAGAAAATQADVCAQPVAT